MEERHRHHIKTADLYGLHAGLQWDVQKVVSLFFWRAQCIPVQPPGHGGPHISLVKKRTTLNPEHPRAATSDHMQVCMHRLTHSQPNKSCEPRKQTSLFSLTGSLFRASTRFRHLTRKGVPKCWFGFFFPQ